MSLISLIIFIAVAGVFVWAITQLPMPAEFQKAIYVVCVVALVLYILSAFGLMRGLPNLRLR